MKAFGAAVIFAVYGSLIGAAVQFCLVLPLSHGYGEHAGMVDYLLAILSIVPMALVILPVAFVLGVLPGMATGLAFWWLMTRTALIRLPLLARAVVMSIVAAVACSVFCLCLGASIAEGSPRSPNQADAD